MHGSGMRVGDIGTVLEFTITDQLGDIVDISTASTKTIKLRSPQGKALNVAATFVTDGTDGKIKYITVADDIDVEGTWQTQCEVIMPSGQWNTEVKKLDVSSNIN
jgi:hypothetical protein